ncbi:MAG: zf-HC2 domain-containing protein [Candidatus Aminicenantes bacterium]|nr:MAG: zf-HC2 domain-containing protein [Candidatus Aminicenantes bacterium]
MKCKCKKAETFLSKSLDGLLTSEEKDALGEHLAGCSSCKKKRDEYVFIAETLGREDFPEASPYFWERLQPRLKESRKYAFWSEWKQWSLRAVPISIFVVFTLALGLALFLPQPADELSQTGDLLLRNSPSLPETVTILEAETGENKSMQLIFMAVEEKPDIRRYFP